MCPDCIGSIHSFVMSRSAMGPHCITMSDTVSDGHHLIVLSFCTGALMRINSRSMWIDSRSVQDDLTSFECCVAPSIGLVPFYS
jgi:hypothetical protein